MAIAFALSVATHVAFMAMPLRRPERPALASTAEAPFTVRIVPAEPAPVPEVAPAREPVREVEPVLTPRRAPAPRPTPAPAPRKPIEMPAPPRSLPEVVAAPQVDMLAAINARRERRRAAEEALAARDAAAGREPSPEEATSANINRNLGSMGGEGVGGVFEILSKGTRRAEFAFNGWRPDSQRKWREVIEVDAGPGGDVERAIVRRMIELIRTHYSGDFRWESHRLGRVVVLSARPEDNDGLEDFLVREFFGTPVLKRP